MPSRRPATARKDLRSLLIAGDLSNIREFPDGRAATVKSFEPLDRGKVQRAELRLGDGQVVFVDVEAAAATVDSQLTAEPAAWLATVVASKLSPPDALTFWCIGPWRSCRGRR